MRGIFFLRINLSQTHAHKADTYVGYQFIHGAKINILLQRTNLMPIAIQNSIISRILKIKSLQLLSVVIRIGVDKLVVWVNTNLFWFFVNNYG